jgi:hypothetical protein
VERLAVPAVLSAEGLAKVEGSAKVEASRRAIAKRRRMAKVEAFGEGRDPPEAGKPQDAQRES